MAVGRGEPDLAALFADGARLWDEFRRRQGPLYHHLVPADHASVAAALGALRDAADTFLELGSGVGVLTIAADLLGYDAHGIEIDPWLVARAEDLAEAHGSEARFAHGSFVPDAFQVELEQRADDFPWLLSGAPAYGELGMELDDFDLVYGFPWPGEQEVLFELMARHARRDAILLTWGATDGVEAYRGGEPIAL